MRTWLNCSFGSIGKFIFGGGWVQWMYPYVMIAFSLQMIGFNVPFGSILVAFMVITLPIALTNALGSATVSEKLVLAYFLICTFTLFRYATDIRPIELFITDFKNSLLPIGLFYLCAKMNTKSVSGVLNWLLYSAVYCSAIGLVLYFWPPSWYLEWKMSSLDSWLSGDSENYVLEAYHLSSIQPHSYFAGYIGLLGFVLSLRRIGLSEGKGIRNIAYALVNLLALSLSLQRIAVAGTVIAWAWFHVVLFRHNKRLLSKVVLADGILLGSLVFGLTSMVLSGDAEFVSRLFRRYNDFEIGKIVAAAVNERTDQWWNVLQIWENEILGHGFGLVGHAANSRGFTAVCDGEIIKVLYETGWIGFGSLVSIWVFVAVKCAKSPLKLSLLLPLLLFYPLATIGANPFSIGYPIIGVYWIVAGIVYSKGDAK